MAVKCMASLRSIADSLIVIRAVICMGLTFIRISKDEMLHMPL